MSNTTIELATEDGAVCADYAARTDERWLDFSGYDVPDHMHGAISRYINDRIAPGSFLEAVLCNDLRKAVASADLVNRNPLADYVKWFHNRAPGGCWGSRERYEAWLKG
jgi:hypothetical protein